MLFARAAPTTSATRRGPAFAPKQEDRSSASTRQDRSRNMIAHRRKSVPIAAAEEKVPICLLAAREASLQSAVRQSVHRRFVLGGERSGAVSDRHDRLPGAAATSRPAASSQRSEQRRAQRPGGTQTGGGEPSAQLWDRSMSHESSDPRAFVNFTPVYLMQNNG